MQARLQEISPSSRTKILVAINHRNVQLHDIYRLNIRTGELTLFRQNDGFMAFLTDDAFRLRGAMRMTPDGGLEIYQPAGDECRSIVGNDPRRGQPDDRRGRVRQVRIWLFMHDSRRAATRPRWWPTISTTGETTLLAEDAQVDVGDIVRHPTEKHVQAVSFVYTRKRWQILDPAIEADLAHLRTIGWRGGDRQPHARRSLLDRALPGR